VAAQQDLLQDGGLAGRGAQLHLDRDAEHAGAVGEGGIAVLGPEGLGPGEGPGGSLQPAGLGKADAIAQRPAGTRSIRCLSAAHCDVTSSP